MAWGGETSPFSLDIFLVNDLAFSKGEKLFLKYKKMILFGSKEKRLGVYTSLVVSQFFDNMLL